VSFSSIQLHPLVYVQESKLKIVQLSLAYSELYVTIAELFSSFELELFETTEEEDVLQFHDFFSPFPKGDRGLRVLVK